MEEFKKEIFNKDFPNIDLKIKTCGDEEADKFLYKITKKYSDFIAFLEGRNLEKLKFICNVQEESGGIEKCFEDDIFSINKMIFIYNLNYNNCYEIDSNYFKTYFDYIWYPASDDMLIFNSLLEDIYYIDHDGSFYKFLLSCPKRPKHHPAKK